MLTPDEKRCEEFFLNTHARDSTGRFVVRLPLTSKPTFSNTKIIARSGLLRSERHLQQDEALAQAYKEFMLEYSRLKHLEIVPRAEWSHDSYYLPHYFVYRPGSKKIRVVFNASQKDASGSSLNDWLLTGLKLQSDFSIVITNWRFFRYVFTCNVTQMFCQILVHPDDRNWQRILWRADSSKPIQEYRATTVTYGTTLAPYLALRVMKQLSLDGQSTHPNAASILQRCFYVDDCFAGDDTVDGAIQKRDQLISLLLTAGMKLDKWASNEPVIIPGNQPHSKPLVGVKLNDVVSALGVKWNHETDSFSFSIEDRPSPSVITKRAILSEIARLFDPLGWIAPVIIQAKAMLQERWLHQLEWDSVLDDALSMAFREQLHNLTALSIPRWSNIFQHQVWHLHGFSDASDRAYAAAIFVVAPGGKSTLLMAKTKVAPIKNRQFLAWNFVDP